jgi:hypothetical protein
MHESGCRNLGRYLPLAEAGGRLRILRSAMYMGARIERYRVAGLKVCDHRSA